MSSNSSIDLLSYWEFLAAQRINLYSPSVIVGVGSIGNLLSFLIYIKRKYKKHVAPVYILALSVIDSLNLIIGLLQYWVMFNFFPNKISKIHCQVRYYNTFN